MTHSGGKPHTNVGDRGQRYEVRYTDEDGQEKVIGWTDIPSGGSLVDAINAHPVWSKARVIDRRPDLPSAHWPTPTRPIDESRLRDQDELQRAHDCLVSIILRDVPFPDVGLTIRDLNLMASVICWSLHHDHNDQFTRHLQNIENDLAARGFEQRKGKPS